MTILIDLVTGTHATIFDDLLQIARCDPGLTTFQASPYVLAVAYQQKQQAVASSSRLLALANATTNILIIGVNSMFVFSDGTAITTLVGGGTLPGSLTEPITIYLDVTDAAGQGYHVLNSQGQTMPMPRQVLLYHELAHAYHMIQGDAPASDQAQQVQAIHDENDFRAQLSIELRNSTNDIGGPGLASHQGFPFPRCKPVDPGFNWDCIVATAAVGSPHAPRVEELRRARREYRNLSLWATLISEPVLDTYRKFSPSVVRDMHADPALRRAMLLYAVQPVFHLVQMTEAYLRADSDSPELMAELDRSVDEYIADLAEVGASTLTLTSAAKDAFLAGRALGSDRVGTPVGPNRREMPGHLFGYLAATIASKGEETTGFAWAFEGIDLFLRQAAARSADGEAITPEFLSALGAWLARLPIPPNALLSIADAREELKVFAERIFTRAHPRAMFAQHLLARWPKPTLPALRLLLQDLSYLQPDHDTME
ncbi:MAG: hypothetical protein WCF57_24300 [Pyrinomonadaceae bacterium]